MRKVPVGMLVGAAAAALSACAVGPNYQRPVTPVPPQFANLGQPGFNGGDVEAKFWTLFKDPRLDRLVDDALTANKDLQRARANLRASRAARRLAGFDLFPTVTAAGSYTHTRESRNQLPAIISPDRTLDAADVGFDAFWELDFFGRVRRGIQAAGAEEQASAASLRDVQVTVTAEVARNYFVLRGLQEQLAVATRNADNQTQTLRVTQARLEAGRGTELDSARAEAQLKTTLASIPLLESSTATTIYRLSVLTGRLPDALAADLQVAEPLRDLPSLNAVGDPATLLRRRPDIRVAERSLAASTARIGVAIGDLFPKVTFTGSVGYNAATFGGLGKTGSDTYSVGPAISWAAFDLGRVGARIKIAHAQADADLAAYEASVLGALEETEGALLTYGRAQSRRELLTQAANASERAADLARQRFQGGLTDFVNVLDAEREALIVEDSLAQSRTQTATSLVAVYKALGGGWVDEPLEAKR
ncbi:MAG: NodT family efflux system outer rane lipoprotein [Gammaproteobacteria bacterium]|nr:NodT family efflux system outer rane lipoprotein [Gammaproteobacteria bacterium]